MQYHSQDKLKQINWNQFLRLSQTFCYWGKQQSADINIIQLHPTLKCTKDQSSHFYNCFLVSKRIQYYDHCLTKFHAGCEQLWRPEDDAACKQMVTARWCPRVTSHCDSHHKRIVVILLPCIMIMPPSSSRVNSVRELYCCWLLSC